MYISLRKKQPEPEPESAEEAPADEQAGPAEDEEVPSLARALAAAVRGWFTWCTGRTNVTVTYWGHGLAVWAAVFYGGWVAVAIVAALVTGVGAFVPRATVDRLTARIEARHQGPAEVEPEPAREPPADPLVALLRHLIGDAPGTHFKTLVEHLEKGAAEAGQEPPTRAEVEAKLAARGIGLRPSVRDAHGRVNRGVHGADLEAALAPSPDAETAPAHDP
ncbi:hypothetical protein ABZ369_22425 [Streptomyces sp. NPDC005918]|uniref:hypothetical protein n=1 Tax=Streptomyces sp. NPDC005918 TaxID=3155454 RepID=UPI0033D43DE1